MITKVHIQAWIDAFNSLDPIKLAELCAGDFKMYQQQNDVPLTKANLMSFFLTLRKSFPDLHFEGSGSIVKEHVAASWGRVTGSMTGSIAEPSSGKQYEPTGKSFDVNAGLKMTFNDRGLMVEVRVFWDETALYSQLGLL